MQKRLLIDMAKSMIEKGFKEDSIKIDLNHYIDFKFNNSISFADITEIHFDVFRKDKNTLHKINAMTIIELIILASDIMDDMQDKDAQKNVPWYDIDDNYNFNIVVGIMLICLKEVTEIGNGIDIKWVQENIYQSLLQSISGQQTDLKNNLMSEADYLHMCYMKSGSLIALACLLGAGDVNKERRKHIKEYANYLGVIFQLRNDVNDMKNGFIKNDLLSKKRTLPILYYLNTDDKDYAAIQAYYLDNSSDHDVSMIHKELMNGEALLYCSIVEKIFIYKYNQAICRFKLPKKHKNLLLNITST